MPISAGLREDIAAYRGFIGQQYLRSNYLNKDGKASIMMRIHLNGERMALGTTGVPLQ